MTKMTIIYLLLNLFLLLAGYMFLQNYITNIHLQEKGLIGSLIIIGASILVYANTVSLPKILRSSNVFIIYLYGTLIKDGIILGLCLKYKDVVKEMIFFFTVMFIIAMFLEILFILKSIKNIENLTGK